jgi:hypothetical protein
MNSKARATIFLLFLAFLVGCRGLRDAPLTAIAESHIEANVPKGKLFDEFLERDLTNYFCREAMDCTVKYEFLREGPTQTGLSYPKYYLWVKKLKGTAVTDEGAVRVAAVDQNGFDVTHFLSREQISASRSQVASIFPAALVDKIVQKSQAK